MTVRHPLALIIGGAVLLTAIGGFIWYPPAEGDIEAVLQAVLLVGLIIAAIRLIQYSVRRRM